MKRLFFFLFIITVILSLVSCDYLVYPPTGQPPQDGDTTEEPTTEYVTVTLHFNNGMKSESYKQEKGTGFKTPEEPTRRDYTFDGWYKDEELTEKYDFSELLSESITLYASWQRDLSDLANDIAVKKLESCLHIQNTKYNVGYFGEVTEYEDSYGSGVIFYEKSGFYYCLTNEHVTSKGGYRYSSYTVYDAYGEAFDAQLIASDPQYDLAILKFESAGHLSAAKFSEGDASVGSVTASVGNPNGLLNVVTFGEILQYAPIMVTEDSEIQVAFPVGIHNTPVDHGSSGGPVFGEDLTLVGINFAASASISGNYSTAYFIPISYVNTFLSIYFFV